jgi:hypothetical protein
VGCVQEPKEDKCTQTQDQSQDVKQNQQQDQTQNQNQAQNTNVNVKNNNNNANTNNNDNNNANTNNNNNDNINVNNNDNNNQNTQNNNNQQNIDINNPITIDNKPVIIITTTTNDNQVLNQPLTQENIQKCIQEGTLTANSGTDPNGAPVMYVMPSNQAQTQNNTNKTIPMETTGLNLQAIIGALIFLLGIGVSKI